MSPRSEELLGGATKWLSSARAALSSGFPESATADAYYAALYAARAALSEEDRYAKTHGGVWDLFYLVFVESGRFDEALAADARRTERLRLDAHYEALPISTDEAQHAVDTAERFAAAVERLFPPEVPE